MQYLLLIYSEEGSEANRSPEETDALWQKYFEFNAKTREAGVFLGGNALQSTTTATTLRMEGDKPMSIDGPFAETKEALGGFYMLDCKDLDEALDWAKQCPALAHGAIEVRPVMDVGMDEAAG